MTLTSVAFHVKWTKRKVPLKPLGAIVPLCRRGFMDRAGPQQLVERSACTPAKIRRRNSSWISVRPKLGMDFRAQSREVTRITQMTRITRRGDWDHTEKYFRNLIKWNQNQILFTMHRVKNGKYNWYGNKRTYFRCQINGKMVNTNGFHFELIRLRKDFSVCTAA